MPDGFTIDFSEFNRAVDRAMKMGDVRRRDIADVFRKADRPMIRSAKATVKSAKRDTISRAYPSRSHRRGNLKRGIGFAVSKRKKLVYYVRSKAWYTGIYVTGHGSYMGNSFIERARHIYESSIINKVKRDLGKLIERTWKNG